MCWLPQVPAWFSRLADIVAAYEKGSLFRSGAITDQPAWFLPIARWLITCREEFLAERVRRESENRAAMDRARAAARGRR